MTQYLEWKDILQRKEEEKIYGSGESDDGCPPPTAAAPTKEKRGDSRGRVATNSATLYILETYKTHTVLQLENSAIHGVSHFED